MVTRTGMRLVDRPEFKLKAKPVTFLKTAKVFEAIEEMADKFKAAGATRQAVSQIWNREGTFKLGFMWEYKDEKAFIQCQSLFREAEIEFQKRTGITWKITPNRGIVVNDMYF